MNQFDYHKTLSKLMVPEVMDAVSAVHEYRGKQDLYLATKPETLEKLCEVAKIQSTASSNRIENIKTSDVRLRALMLDKAEPKNRDEREIAGYRHVLDTIHSSYPHIPITPSVILQLHRDLYQSLNTSHAGHWKDSDNAIVEYDTSGNAITRFVPTSAAATPGAVESLCDAYRNALDDGVYDPLLVCALFVFDFVSIHPFIDGNGRMSRLLTLLLLYKNNYLVGRYVSVEKMIEETKETYYEALAASSRNWHNGENDYLPFVSYLLGVVLACYKELDKRMLIADGASGEETVWQVFETILGAASKREIADACPTISPRTVERALQSLLAQGKIEKVGAARATKYRRVW